MGPTTTVKTSFNCSEVCVWVHSEREEREGHTHTHIHTHYREFVCMCVSRPNVGDAAVPPFNQWGWGAEGRCKKSTDRSLNFNGA